MHDREYTLAQIRELVRTADERGLSGKARERLQWLLFFYETGETVEATCARFGITRSAFYRVMRRFDPADPSTLEDRSRRPHTVRESSLSIAAHAFVRRYREERPGVSAEAIAQVLSAEHGITVSPSAVARLIRREGWYFGSSPVHRRKRMIVQGDSPAASIDRRRQGVAASVMHLVHEAVQQASAPAFRAPPPARVSAGIAPLRRLFAFPSFSMALLTAMVLLAAGVMLSGVVERGATSLPAQLLHHDESQNELPTLVRDCKRLIALHDASDAWQREQGIPHAHTPREDVQLRACDDILQAHADYSASIK